MAVIIDDVRRRLEANGPACSIDEVVDLCPDLTWNQVFLAVNHLNRTSQVQLVLDSLSKWRTECSVRIQELGVVPVLAFPKNS
jgi:hypothetical protein